MKESKNPGFINFSDLKLYNPKKQLAFCYKLDKNFTLCGPNLPSSGTICILQALIIYENILKKSNSVNLDQILSILNFVYYSRSRDLADPEFEEINPDSLLDKKLLLENFKLFNQKLEKVDSININKLLNSTTHFSIIDNKGNIISATSSIESSFGSRLFTNGFFLNNQLTDFSFKIKDKNNNLIKNRPEGGKRPLSSMSPIIVLDENDQPFLTIGYPVEKLLFHIFLEF